MTAKQLNELFTTHEKRSVDFISWAQIVCGVSFSDSEVSRHRKEGGQGITKSFEALYTVYFRLVEESQKAENQPFKNLI